MLLLLVFQLLLLELKRVLELLEAEALKVLLVRLPCHIIQVGDERARVGVHVVAMQGPAVVGALLVQGGQACLGVELGRARGGQSGGWRWKWGSHC